MITKEQKQKVYSIQKQIRGHVFRTPEYALNALKNALPKEVQQQVVYAIKLGEEKDEYITFDKAMKVLVPAGYEILRVRHIVEDINNVLDGTYDRITDAKEKFYNNEKPANDLEEAIHAILERLQERSSL